MEQELTLELPTKTASGTNSPPGEQDDKENEEFNLYVNPPSKVINKIVKRVKSRSSIMHNGETYN